MYDKFSETPRIYSEYSIDNEDKIIIELGGLYNCNYDIKLAFDKFSGGYRGSYAYFESIGDRFIIASRWYEDEEGAVDFVDDAGQIHMKWDNGCSITLIPGEDLFFKIPQFLQTLKCLSNENCIYNFNFKPSSIQPDEISVVYFFVQKYKSGG